MSNIVNCPCCQKELYQSAHIEGPHFGKVSGPELQQQFNRAFMVCPHCQCEVEFEGSGSMKISPIQPCLKKAPQQS